jgi:hypothetical protein
MTDQLLCWDHDDLDEAKRSALKTIIDFYEKSHDQRAEIIYLLDALDYLHDDLLAWAQDTGFPNRSESHDNN